MYIVAAAADTRARTHTHTEELTPGAACVRWAFDGGNKVCVCVCGSQSAKLINTR